MVMKVGPDSQGEGPGSEGGVDRQRPGVQTSMGEKGVVKMIPFHSRPCSHTWGTEGQLQAGVKGAGDDNWHG